MATPAFGRTWWGEQWLNALTHIDYDNRLPRGRSYANKGAVRDLGVSGGIIRAKVKGSQASPYRVTIDVPAMTAADAERLLDAIAADPSLIARLLNREFDPAAAQTKAVKAIPARCFIAMSGTPVENRFSEYWSIMDFANRGYLGTLPHFVREFATPIQVERDAQVAQRFRRVTAPFLLRRLKSDRSIISDLPDKVEQNQYCQLGSEQTALYESVVQEGLKTISGESDTFRRQGLVLQMIMALKQICNHPAHYLKQGGGDELRELFTLRE
ncbi:DEAD/DEAH box helicase [Rhodocyclus purpureus]|uniref:DEAD/DEAH box helicase n=1 Tax=Rhodocyclus purpureus TaxID=1067 RepID=UPI0019114AC4|nr:DEAD/DEAH box helicase [Rhodocyclus purpureus]